MGMNTQNGRSLTELDHLRQSIVDILNTPIGSRVMRRDYGSKLFNLIDAPLNRGTLVDIYAATAEALMQWERRLIVSAVDMTSAQLGQITLKITGKYILDGKIVQLSEIVVGK